RSVDGAAAFYVHLGGAAAVEIDRVPSAEFFHQRGEFGAEHTGGFVTASVDDDEQKTLSVAGQAHGGAGVASMEIAAIGKTGFRFWILADDRFAFDHQLGKTADERPGSRRISAVTFSGRQP